MRWDVYGGAVVLITHDMHLVELVADRLWLVQGGTVRPYGGDLAAYRAGILGGAGSRRAQGDSRPPPARKAERQAAAAFRARRKPLKDAVAAAEQRIARAQEAQQPSRLHLPRRPERTMPRGSLTWARNWRRPNGRKRRPRAIGSPQPRH